MINMPEILTGTLRRMHYVQRYSSVPVINPENVAEHSWQIAMLSYLMGSDLNLRHIEAPVNMGTLLVKAITHDVSETLSGDIIRSYKHSSPSMVAACHEADRINMNKLAREIGGPTGQRLVSDWSRAKNDSIEGDIVGLADLFCVVSYCVNEHELGSRKCDYVLKAMYEETLRHWHDHRYLGDYVDQVFPRKRWYDPITRGGKVVMR